MPTKALLRWFLTFLSIGSVAVACSDAGSPVEPTALAKKAKPDVEAKVTFGAKALKRQSALTSYRVVAMIKPNKASTISIPETGLVIRVPIRSVDRAVLVTITAIPGDVIAYQFEPHGTTFKAPLSFEQNLRGTPAWRNFKQGFGLAGVYFPTDLQLDPATGEYQVVEILASRIDAEKKKLIFPISHFSGYMIATGMHGRGGAD